MAIMSEEEKRFKIKKKESYESQITEEKRNAVVKTFLLGLWVIAACASYVSAARQNDAGLALYRLSLGMIDSGFAISKLKKLLESISRKTMLEGKVEDIVSELELSEIEEERGKSL